MNSKSSVLLSFIFIVLISCQQEQGNYTTIHNDGRYIYGVWKAPTKNIASDVINVISNNNRTNSAINPKNTQFGINKDKNIKQATQNSVYNGAIDTTQKPLPYITTDAPVKLLPKNGDTDDWVHAGIPSTYNSNTLYNDRFVSPDIYYNYGYQRQAEVEYQSPKHRSIPLILVEIFDMGSPENAFGIYSVYSYAHHEFEWIGCKAIISPKYIRFWKGKYFIQIEGYEIATPIREGMIDFAKVIARNIKDSTKDIPLFKLLPIPPINGSEKLFTNNWSLRYIDKSLPRIIPELTDGTLGISAKYYDISNKKSLNPYTVFLFHFPNASEAESAYNEYRNNLLKEKIPTIESNNSITINEQFVEP